MIEDRMVEALAKSGLDAVIASSRENVLYLSGVRNMSHDLIPSRYTFVVWPRAGDPTYVVIASEEGTARLESRIKDIRTYTEFAVAPAALLAQVLRDRGLVGKRIGLEWRGTTLEVRESLDQLLPGTDFAPVDSFFDRLRMIKTEAEVGLLAEATHVTERAIRAAFAAARSGDTERSLANAIARHLYEGGADNVAWIVLGAGPNAAIVHPKPGPHQIREGDIVRVDLGAWFRGLPVRPGPDGRRGPAERPTAGVLREAPASRGGGDQGHPAREAGQGPLPRMCRNPQERRAPRRAPIFPAHWPRDRRRPA